MILSPCLIFSPSFIRTSTASGENDNIPFSDVSSYFGINPSTSILFLLFSV